MTELRNCPFCGGKAYFNLISMERQAGVQSFEYEIKCKECSMKIPQTFYTSFSFYANGEIKVTLDEREKAIKAWNKRV